jgi:hypothetical protein
MKSFINVLLITITLGLATHAQADTIQNEGLSQTQLRNDPMAAFAATENLGVPLTAVEADGMRGEVAPLVAYYAIQAFPFVYGVAYSCGILGQCGGAIFSTYRSRSR